MDAETRVYHMARIDLEDRCRPMATTMLANVLTWLTDHAETIRWTFR